MVTYIYGALGKKAGCFLFSIGRYESSANEVDSYFLQKISNPIPYCGMQLNIHAKMLHKTVHILGSGAGTEVSQSSETLVAQG
jgi:hypothetical protein